MTARKLSEVIVLHPGERVRVEIIAVPALGEGAIESESRDVVAVVTLETPEEPTPRELDVLRLVASGYTNRQAAEKLCIGKRTVESHRANLMGKLGLSGRLDLVRYARELGLI